MTELHKILSQSISSSRGIDVTVDSGIPKTTIRIIQSTKMIFYGIGKQNEPGFALYLSVDKKSKMGSEIIEKLTREDILKGFRSFDEKNRITYVFDFIADIDLIVFKTNELLTSLKPFSLDSEISLIVNHSNDFHKLE